MSLWPRRHSLAWAMALIAVIAADLAALRAILPRIPNPGLVIMALVLEVGLFRMVTRTGASRRFWIGFEVAGWAYVIACEIFASTAWRLLRSLFEGCILGRPIGSPSEMNGFILFAGGLQLSISLAIVLIVGILTRSVWSRGDLDAWIDPSAPGNRQFTQPGRASPSASGEGRPPARR